MTHQSVRVLTCVCDLWCGIYICHRDFGGQEVFYTLHHLFLTRSGPFHHHSSSLSKTAITIVSYLNIISHVPHTTSGFYMVVFNMEKFCLSTVTEQEKAEAVGMLRFWLSSIAIHTRQTASDTTGVAPIALVGTHKDK